MKHRILLLLFLAGAAGWAAAQTLPPITTPQLTIPLSTPPRQVPSATVRVVGSSGNSTYYYWVVSDYLIGDSTPAGPFPALSAPNTLSAANYVQVSIQPVAGALSYDVLRTTSPAPPSGACVCAVAIATSSAVVSDQSASLQAYSVSPYDPAGAAITLTNQPTGAGANKLAISFGGSVAFSVGSNGAIGYQSVTSVSPSISPTNLGPSLLADGFSGATYAEKVAAAFASAQCSAGCTVSLPTGTLAWDEQLVVPAGIHVAVEGQGIGATILAATNGGVIAGPASGGADGDYFGRFSVQAPAAGTAAPAIDVAGFRTSVFQDIGYVSNGSGTFGAFFHFSATPDCYGNKIDHPFMQSQVGPPTVFEFDNRGSGNVGENANENYIEHAWVYANSGIATIVDARRSSLTVISDSGFEDNAGATVLVPGSMTTWARNWMEANAAVSILGSAGVDGSSNGDLILGNNFSGAQSVQLGAGNTGWRFVNNTPCNPMVAGVESDNTAIVCGASVSGDQPDVVFSQQNIAAGGGHWGTWLSGTGGTYPAGSLSFVDLLTSRSHITMFSGGGNYVSSGSSSAPALVVSPFDDLGPSSCVLQVTNAAQSVQTACISKEGDISAAGNVSAQLVNATTIEMGGKAVALSGAGGVSSGTVVVSSSTTGSYTFVSPYVGSPICVAVPRGTTPTAAGGWAVSANQNAVTVTVGTSGTYIFNFVCYPSVN